MQLQKKSISSHVGFTLIELLIVVAIIAILAAIAIPNFLEAQTRARVSRAKADIRTIVTALESYKVDSNKYISGEELTNPQANKDVWGPSFNPQMVRLTSPIAYMSSLPESSPFDPWFESFYAARGFKFRGYKYLGGDWWTSFAGGSNGMTPRETYSLPTSKGGWGFLSEGCLNSEFILFVPGPIRRISIGDGTNHFTIYDPTNGTVSRGEILYVGGPRAEEFNSFK